MIDPSELRIGAALGAGAQGAVHAAWYQETPVAVKRTSSQREVDMHLHAGPSFRQRYCPCSRG